MSVFMYRKGEARVFASLSDVPAGEGWSDVPPADMHVHDDGRISFGDEPKPEPDAAPVVETTEEQPEPDTEPAEIDVLRARATELGITVDGRWGVNKIRRMIAEAESPNGDGA